MSIFTKLCLPQLKRGELSKYNETVFYSILQYCLKSLKMHETRYFKLLLMKMEKKVR